MQESQQSSTKVLLSGFLKRLLRKKKHYKSLIQQSNSLKNLLACFTRIILIS